MDYSDSCSSGEDVDNFDFDQGDPTARETQQNVLQAGREQRASYEGRESIDLEPTVQARRDSALQRQRKTSVLHESEQETLFRFRNTFASVVESDADTLVYVGIPPQTPDQDDYEYESIKGHFQSPYLLRSSTLRALQSPKMDKFLGPTSARTERRFKKMGLYKLVSDPRRIKYCVDLSPIINDEEALIQITQLTVPSGALKWHKEAKDYCIASDPVCGRDDLDIPPKPMYTLQCNDVIEEQVAVSDESSGGSIPAAEKAASQGSLLSNQKMLPYERSVEEEYSSLRHHTTTVRLLQAICGNDPKLDSAAKAWTFCMLANYFDCAEHPVVSHWIISWMLQYGNDKFISVHPDIAYRMAMATKSEWLMRCTFAILVGQQAMLDGSHTTHDISQPKSRAGTHVTTCLDDDDINRIDHASTALAQRVRTVYDELTQFPGAWSFSSPRDVELSKLRSLDAEDEKIASAVKGAEKCLKHYVQRMIYMTFSDSYAHDNKRVSEYRSCRPYATYKEIPRPLRLLTRYCWDVLKFEEYTRDYLDTPNNHRIWEETVGSLRQQDMMAAEEVPYVSKKQILDAIHRLNMCLVERHRKANSNAKTRLSAPLTNHSAKRSVGNRSITPEITNPVKQVKFSPQPSPCDLTTESLSERSRQTVATTANLRLVTSDTPAFPAGNYDQFETQRGSESPQGPWEGTRTQITTTDETDTPADYLASEDEWEDLVRMDEPVRHPAQLNIPIRNKTPAPDASSLGPDPETASDVSEPQDALSKAAFAHTPENLRQLSIGASLTAMDPASNQQASNSIALPASLPFRSSGTRVQAQPGQSYERLDESKYAATANSAQNTQSQGPAGGGGSSLTGNWPSHGGMTGELPSSQGLYTRFDSLWDNDEPYVPLYPTGPNRIVHKEKNAPYCISALLLLSEIGVNIHRRVDSLTTPGYIQDRTCDFEIPVDNISTLLCLDENEYKYLPMWAGGLDDGSGGVFDDGVEVPDAPEVAEGGFRGGAMGIIPGVGSSLGGSIAGSEFEDLGTEAAISTVGKASRYATDGTATETVMSLDD